MFSTNRSKVVKFIKCKIWPYVYLPSCMKVDSDSGGRTWLCINYAGYKAKLLIHTDSPGWNRADPGWLRSHKGWKRNRPTWRTRIRKELVRLHDGLTFGALAKNPEAFGPVVYERKRNGSPSGAVGYFAVNYPTWGVAKLLDASIQVDIVTRIEHFDFQAGGYETARGKAATFYEEKVKAFLEEYRVMLQQLINKLLKAG